MDCNPRKVLHTKPGTVNSPVAANNQESVVVPVFVALVKNEVNIYKKNQSDAAWHYVYL